MALAILGAPLVTNWQATRLSWFRVGSGDTLVFYFKSGQPKRWNPSFSFTHGPTPTTPFFLAGRLAFSAVKLLALAPKRRKKEKPILPWNLPPFLVCTGTAVAQLPRLRNPLRRVLICVGDPAVFDLENLLQRAELKLLNQTRGPESIVFDYKWCGRWTEVADGRGTMLSELISPVLRPSQLALVAVNLMGVWRKWVVLGIWLATKRAPRMLTIIHVRPSHLNSRIDACSRISCTRLDCAVLARLCFWLKQNMEHADLRILGWWYLKKISITQLFFFFSLSLVFFFYISCSYFGQKRSIEHRLLVSWVRKFINAET